MKTIVHFAILLCMIGTGPVAPAAGPQRPIEGKFTPPPGKMLLVIGQDVDAVAGYTASVWPTPAGVTTYTDISETAGRPLLYGLKQTVNYGAGDVNGQHMLERYPTSVLVIGLYLVDNSGTNLAHLADGTHNGAIDALGAFIQAAKRPVFVRIGYEFDSPWNHYPPKPYVAAFRHIVDRWRAAGVANVATVWQSAAWGKTYRNHPLAAWYPGDAYVDWVGTSYFQLQRPVHDVVLTFARQHHKPVMIAEATPQGYDLGALTYAPPSTNGSHRQPRTAAAIWAEWYRPFFAYVYENADVIRAVAYINADWDAQPIWAAGNGNGYWGDSRVQANDQIKRWWRSEISKDRWLHGGPTLFGQLD